MSSSNKSTSRGGKGSKAAESGGKSHGKTDGKSDTGGNNKSNKSSQDGRLSQILDRKPDSTILTEKVKFVMETTCKTEEEVCLVLHDCDYDMEQAILTLLESSSQSAFATSVKKKKNRQSSTSKTETADGGGGGTGGAEDWDAPQQSNLSGIQGGPGGASGNSNAPDRERARNRGGPRLTKGRGDSRGWRGREGRTDGERANNQDDSNRGGNDGYNRRGRENRMSNGPGRGGGSGRGGRGGGRMGPRTYQSRDGGPRSHNRNMGTVETWEDPSTNQNSGVETWEDTFPQPEDWDNEEYTGSLADTKVFTPSQAMEAAAAAAAAAAVAAANAIAADPNTITAEKVSSIESQNVPELSTSGGQSMDPLSAMRGATQQQQQTQHDLRQTVHLQQPQSNTLSAAQTQYLNQLTQQSTENMKAAAAAAAAVISAQQANVSNYPSAGTQYSSQANAYNSQTYGQSPNTYGASSLQDPQSVQSQPTRTKTQRARVPPPSKIPSSAVEMPGDLNTSMGFLDVQFGGMDLVSDPASFEDSSNKYTGLVEQTSTLVDAASSLNQQTPTSLDPYNTSAKQTAQSNISVALGQNQILSNTDSISQASDHLSSQTSGYNTSRSGNNNTVQNTIDTVKSADVSHNAYSQQPNSYQSYQSQKSNSSAYQTPSAYNANTYSTNVQVTSTSTYPTNQSTNNSYSTNNSNTSNSAYNQSTVNNSYQTSSYSTSAAAVAAASAYQNVAPASFSSMNQQQQSVSGGGGTSSFPSNQSSGYQPSQSQSVYAATAGINNSNSYPNQYNSYNTASNNHKLSSKEQVQYDNVNTAGSGTAAVSNAVSSVNATPTLAALSQTTSANTKVTTTSTAKSGVVPNIPPGVAPMMGTQYIMGQAGVPFYQQPVYSFEELQLLQQRIPHMTTGYYDIPAYQQAPTSLATQQGERALASVAYSMSNDGRFTRADNNASPVPSTISQQISTTTQAHQAQPMLNATALPPGYAYFYNTGMMPGSYQYSTPAIYSQMPAAANAHGSTTSSQYPKPGSYGSGYNSGYDALSQTQDYNKSAYVGPNQSQNKSGVAVTTGSSATDLTSMYGKTHAALGKVNSYDKQAFHSATPPPFNLAGSQSAGLAPSGQYTPHLFIPTMAPHQTHHSTTLMHQPLHQDSSNSSGQRSQTSSQAKPGSKQPYQASYWNQA